MLISETSEPVIGTDEQIVTRDVCRIVERRAMWLYSLGQLMPFSLYIVIQGTPCGQSPAMNIQLSQLRVSTGEHQPRAILVIAPTLPMKEGHVSYGTVAVVDYNRWCKPGHIGE
jgi:hypothetical protein